MKQTNKKRPTERQKRLRAKQKSETVKANREMMHKADGVFTRIINRRDVPKVSA
jgi:hypothetical protein